jgi:pimeloyl-ACP methyl ester carboxylesterase
MTIPPANCESTPPARRNYIGAHGVRLSYLEWNSDGPPVVLLHGITSSARTWWRVAPALVEQGYHVYAFDMPGHGESAETDDHHIPAIARLIAAAMRALDIDDAVVIGHSWGGATALDLASVVSDRPALRKVVLIDPALGMTPERGKEALPNFMVGIGDPPEANRTRLRAANPLWSDCDVHWKVEALAQCRPAAVRGLFLESDAWNLTAHLAQVDVPLLLLVADPQYTVIPPETLAAAERAIRQDIGRVVVVPGTDHNMFRAGYDKTVPILLDWLLSS